MPVYHDEPIRPPWDATTAGPAPAPPPAPHPDQALTARLAHWYAAEQAVVDVVRALDTAHGRPLTVALLDSPVGSDYLPATNTIVLSTKYAMPELATVADRLILYRLATAFELLGVNTRDAEALQTYNGRQQRLWRLANPPQDPPPADMYRFYHGTNRCNFYDGIQVTGLTPSKAGSAIGCKRWERHDIARESKDQGWNTATLDFDLALSYARQHTEWAMGRKRNEPTLRDVASEGGLVLAFDMPKKDVDGNDQWRQDNSGNPNNFQTMQAIPAEWIRVVEELGIPGPLTAVAPPPTPLEAPTAKADPTPGTRRRVYPKSTSEGS
ncbi:hypothetical protein GCM10027280_05870 [Micromonospora polyrhachis]|uniref:Uncharacterized protein n=1 Tax=Micromonospora polyrhachis TaxID=1282883 RepID=A0A7W7SKJ8_9ACTN|nr:hypothetical protein [Micromonospora polyrhachis]MBB4956504.1 hypothetical protein [Micromonospora polyrhachis]